MYWSDDGCWQCAKGYYNLGGKKCYKLPAPTANVQCLNTIGTTDIHAIDNAQECAAAIRAANLDRGASGDKRDDEGNAVSGAFAPRYFLFSFHITVGHDRSQALTRPCYCRFMIVTALRVWIFPIFLPHCCRFMLGHSLGRMDISYLLTTFSFI